jgi:hypothetical protein
VTVTITEAGRDVLARVFPGHIDVLRQLFLEPLARADIDSLARVLVVHDHTRSIPPRSAKPRRKRRTPEPHWRRIV